MIITLRPVHMPRLRRIVGRYYMGGNAPWANFEQYRRINRALQRGLRPDAVIRGHTPAVLWAWDPGLAAREAGRLSQLVEWQARAVAALNGARDMVAVAAVSAPSGCEDADPFEVRFEWTDPIETEDPVVLYEDNEFFRRLAWRLVKAAEHIGGMLKRRGHPQAEALFRLTAEAKKARRQPLAWERLRDIAAKADDIVAGINWRREFGHGEPMEAPDLRAIAGAAERIIELMEAVS